MTNHPEVREPCPRLERIWPIWLGRDPVDGTVYFTIVQVHDDDFKVPCRITPLLTAAEREKLLGEGQ